MSDENVTIPSQDEAVMDVEPEQETEAALSTSAEEESRTGVEEISACSSTGGYCCSFVGNMDPRVRELIYWKKPVTSAVFLVTTLAFLCMSCCHGYINTVSFLLLVLLSVSFAANAVGYVAKRFLGKDVPNPINNFLANPIDIPEEKVSEIAHCIAGCCEKTAVEMRRLYCIVDIPDSFKFGVGLWFVYWITSCITFIDMLILIEVLLFSVPKVYELYQVQINKALGVAKKQVLQVLEKAKALPYVDQALKAIAPPKEKSS